MSNKITKQEIHKKIIERKNLLLNNVKKTFRSVRPRHKRTVSITERKKKID